MLDSFGRKIEYMRVSVTDRCNLRCGYCMPNGIKCIPMEEILSFEEITDICRIAAENGIKYIRLTGGEPLARIGAEKLVGMIKSVEGIEKVTMTTNGVLLAEKLPKLKASGLDGVNISLDTLDREKYKAITGSNCLDKVLESIDRSFEAGLKVKINAVVLKETAEECINLIQLAKDRPIDVRFIEMMPIGEGKHYESISCEYIMDMIKAAYPSFKGTEGKESFGPARYYHIDGFEGNIGFINAVHDMFCGDCNRIRLTSTGFLKTCLCYEDGESLREPLREGNMDEVRRRFRSAVENKPKNHCFTGGGNISEKSGMNKIGG
ncbi:MAG: GTP 3',8-cyclase MoaA [Clostridiales bacterium]|nr:GTP 3',8-cyclase MoaA [Clostridiales bacterium]